MCKEEIQIPKNVGGRNAATGQIYFVTGNCSVERHASRMPITSGPWSTQERAQVELYELKNNGYANLCIETKVL